MMVTWVVRSQVAKKIIFTACHSGKLKLAFTSPEVITTSPQNFLTSRSELISQFFCYSNSSKNITCPLGKLKTEFTSPIAKSTSPGLSDTTFFVRWLCSCSNFLCPNLIRSNLGSVIKALQFITDNKQIEFV